MKRRIITTVTVCVFLALVLAVRLSDREKNDNSIPSKETVAAYILEKGEQYAAEQLRGQDRNSVRRSWGDPDAMPSGIWADVWDLDADTTLLVFYDAENKDTVERVVLALRLSCVCAAARHTCRVQQKRNKDRQFRPEYTAGDDTGASVSIRLSTAVF